MLESTGRLTGNAHHAPPPPPWSPLATSSVCDRRCSTCRWCRGTQLLSWLISELPHPTRTPPRATPPRATHFIPPNVLPLRPYTISAIQHRRQYIYKFTYNGSWLPARNALDPDLARNCGLQYNQASCIMHALLYPPSSCLPEIVNAGTPGTAEGDHLRRICLRGRLLDDQELSEQALIHIQCFHTCPC